MVYIEFKQTNGTVIRLPAREVAAKLGLNLHPGDAVSMVCRDDDCGDELIATSRDWDSKNYAYPGIDLSQVIGEESGLLSSTELPNEDNNQVVTYIYAGNDQTESDDWIACIADGTRAENDESRRVMFVDTDLALAAPIGAGNELPTDPIPYTLEQLLDRNH